MRNKWLRRKKGDRLILFCNGWGMDETPFLPLKCHDWDLLMFYDYQDMSVEEDLSGVLQQYRETILVSWSMGVWVGQQLLYPLRSKLSAALAINGTTSPVDDQLGIPGDVFRATFEAFDEKQRLKFYNRMCGKRVLAKKFLLYQPRRSVESQRGELEFLLEQSTLEPRERSIYNTVFVADRDYIMPTDNQLRFWGEERVRLLCGSHFFFYAYSSWDEMVAAAYDVQR